MRTELPAPFVAAKGEGASRPVNLLVAKFAAGPLYLSDRDLGLAQGLSREYRGLVRDWGQLWDLPLDESRVAETRELTISLWNGGEEKLSDLFLAQDPEAVEVELWQWFEGTPEAAKVLVDEFCISDPITYDEATGELKLDLVSLSVKLDCLVGELIEASEWPNAPAEELGKPVPLVFGTVPGLPCACVAAAPEARLAASILPTDTIIRVDDAGSFPASGVIQIDDERLLYRSRTESTFTVTKRGFGATAAVDHLSGRLVSGVVDHVFLVAKGPLEAITDVKVAGLSPETPYGVHPEADPARIVFQGKPRVARLSESTRFLEMQLDAVAEGNTARLPHLAFDTAGATTAAEIDRDHRELRLTQTTANGDRGAIRKVWLGVEHWESEKLPHDRVEVETSGLGVLGTLSAPHPRDNIEVTAAVDIDHGHSHSFVAEHTHAFTDRQEVLREEAHTHPSTAPQQFTGQLSDTKIKGWAYSFDSWGNKIYWTGLEAGNYVTVTFSGVPGSGRAWLEVTARKCPVFLGQYPRGTYRDGRNPYNGLGGGDKLLDTDCQNITSQVVGRYSLAQPVATLYLSAEKKYCWNATWGYAEILSVKQFVCAEDVASVKTGVSLQVLDPGRNLAVEPLQGGVSSLATQNVQLSNKVESKASKTVVDFFDLTAAVAGDWGWFTGREVRIRYAGSADGRTCYLLHVFFEIEYSPREIAFSNEVTCTAEGLIDDAQGKITGTPGRLICRPDEVRKYLLVAVAGLEPARIDSGSFGAAGARYNELGYRFDFALRSRTTLKELERRLARQCRSRFFWDAGLAKIAVRERDADLVPAKHITASMVLLDSMRAERSRAAELANRIRLFYCKDLLSGEEGPAGYLAGVRAQSAASTAAFGVRERPADFLFDGVREPAMAADLLAFYLEKESRITTTYTFDCFLDAFELEKEDAIRISHPFDNLAGHIAVVRSASRVLGSGAALRPDLVRVAAELSPRRRLLWTIRDEAAAREVVSCERGVELHLADQAHPAAGAALAWGWRVAEQVTAAEELEKIHDPEVALAEVAATEEGLRISALTPTGLAESLFCEERLAISVGQDQVAGLSEAAGAGEELALAVCYAQGLQEAAATTDDLRLELASGYGEAPYGMTPYGR